MLLDLLFVAQLIYQWHAGDVTLDTVNTVLDAKLKAIRCEVMTDDESSEDGLVAAPFSAVSTLYVLLNHLALVIDSIKRAAWWGCTSAESSLPIA